MQARRDFRKMMKKSDIKKTLEQIEDYAAFYDQEDDPAEDNKKDKDEENEEEDEHPGVFLTQREREFYNYGEDMEFVRYHKRTTRNFHSELQALISSSK